MDKIRCGVEGYWAVFITLGCNFKCPYCINKISDDGFNAQINYRHRRGDEWIRALNRIEHKDKNLGIIGGEPGIHPDFLQIINGLDKDWKVTVTTNLDAPIFSDIKGFLKKINLRRSLFHNNRLIFNISFHPEQADAELILNRMVALKKGGLKIGKIFYVTVPNQKIDFPKYKKMFEEKGFEIEEQPFLGPYEGKFYPTEKEIKEGTSGGMDHGVEDYERLKDGFSMKSKRDILCKTRKFLIAPDGMVYNCHYKLYSNAPKNYGNIFDDDWKCEIPLDFFECPHYGYCNPCDYAEVEFKEK